MKGRGAIVAAAVVLAVVMMAACGLGAAAGMEPAAEIEAANGIGPSTAGILPATAPGSGGRNHGGSHDGKGKRDPIFGFPAVKHIPPPSAQRDRFWVTGYFWPVIMVVCSIIVPATPSIRRKVMKWWRSAVAAAAEAEHVPPAAAVADDSPV